MQSALNGLEAFEAAWCFRQAASLLALSEREQAPCLLAGCIVA